MGGAVWRRRLVGALVLVLAPVAALGLWQPVARTQETPVELSAEAGLSSAREAPAWFVEEVIDMAGREELRANGDWSVISFMESEGVSGSSVIRDLEERGWAVVFSGQEGVWTGVKEGGQCSWLSLSCTKVGDATCVVLQVGAPK